MLPPGLMWLPRNHMIGPRQLLPAGAGGLRQNLPWRPGASRSLTQASFVTNIQFRAPRFWNIVDSIPTCLARVYFLTARSGINITAGLLGQSDIRWAWRDSLPRDTINRQLRLGPRSSKTARPARQVCGKGMKGSKHLSE
jgi:hypothetical protein